jgi:ligand-binding sensor domain-containing protein
MYHWGHHIVHFQIYLYSLMKENIHSFWAYLYLALWLLAFHNNAKGQGVHLSQISTEQGLPGPNINNMYQDGIGYLWFGVEAVGLCKYDGKQFKLYDNAPDNPHSLSNNFIQDITSFENNLWIATENGLNYFYREKDLFFQFFKETFNITDNQHNCLLLDATGNLWVGTNNGLNKISAMAMQELDRLIRSGQPVYRAGFNIRNYFFNDSITSKYGEIQVLHLLQDSNKRLWVSTNKGIFILNPSTGELKHLIQNAGNLPGLPNNLVHFVSEYGAGEYLIGTNRGLCKYYIKEDRIIRETFPEIKKHQLEYKAYRCYLKDSEGIEWIGLSEGLLMIDHKAGKTNRFTYIPEDKHGLKSKVIRDIIEDQTGQIWIATKFGGVHVVKKHQDVFKTFTFENAVNKSNRVKDNFVLSLLADKDDKIWIGTKNGGLLKFDYTGNIFESFWIDLELESPSNSNRIEYLYEDSEKNIWMGTPKGLNRLDKQSGKFTLYPFYFTTAILEDSRATLWIGTLNGIYVFDRKSGTFQTYPNKGNRSFFTDSSLKITCLFEDSRNNLWFGTSKNGIFVYQPKNNNIKRYVNGHGNPSTLSSNLVRTIYEVGDSVIWVGTKHGGLNLSIQKQVFSNSFLNQTAYLQIQSTAY